MKPCTLSQPTTSSRKRIAVYALAAFRFAAFLSILILLLILLALIQLVPNFRASLSPWLVSQASRLILRVCGVAVAVDPRFVKQLNAQSGPLMLVANHVSYLDIIVTGSLRPTLFLSKAELRSWPLIGHVARLAGVIFVERESMPSRIRCLLALRKAFAQQRTLSIFPEGTTTAHARPNIKNWQRGQAWAALQSGASIACIGLRYQNQAALAWIDDMEFLPHLFELFCRRKTLVSLSGELLNPPPRSSAAELSRMCFERVTFHCETLFDRDRFHL